MAEDAADAVFAADYTYWVGIDTDPNATEAEIDEFNEFYTRFHLPEVLRANPGFTAAARYRLEGPDPRGDLGPMWLTAYAIEDQAGADRYVARERDPNAERPNFTPGPALWKRMSPRWRLMWRQVFSLGPHASAPEAIMMVGMDPAEGASEQDLEAFDAFYSATHVPEVLAGGSWQAGTRYEQYAAFVHLRPDDCPRFCAVYEGDGSDRPAGPPPGSPAPGPDVWENRDSKWRLRYRLVSPPMTRAHAGVSA